MARVSDEPQVYRADLSARKRDGGTMTTWLVLQRLDECSRESA